MNEIFSLRLKELRQSIGISQSLLAEKFGLKQQAVAKWEQGTSTPNPEIVGN